MKEGDFRLTTSNPGLNLINTLLSVGMFLPIMKEIGKLVSGSPDIRAQLKDVPGGEQVLQYFAGKGS